MHPFRQFEQATASTSPWSLRIRIKVALWELCWAVFCSWTPKPFNRWRVMWARFFGATIQGNPFIHGRSTLIRPWNLTMEERSCVGDGGVLYCLDRVVLGRDSTVAQGAYICTGTHDLNDPTTPLRTAPITVGYWSFIGLRAIVLPGVDVAPGSIVGAGAVLTRDTEAWSIYGGSPAKKIGDRKHLP